MQEIIKELKRKKVAFIRFFFPDILGDACDFSIPIEEFPKAIEGKGFDGSSVHGMARIDESDLIAKPDLKTLRIFPWLYEAKLINKKWREAVVFCDILRPDGKHYEGDTRFVLKRVLKEMRGSKIADNFCVGPELEFFLFKADENGNPLVKEGKPILMDHGGYFKGGRFGEIRKEVQLILKKMQIIPEYDHHECAFSQHEIDFRFMNALKMADTLLLLKYVIKKVARKYGLFASFMPKPIQDINGSGMHINMSLFKEGKNLFYDEKNKLSEIALHFLGGLIHRISEITSVLNQYVNSYKRLVPGYEAPCYITWAFKNRSDLIRIPAAKEETTRIELRSPDPACNPYLAFALILKAGLEGIKKKIDPIKPTEENVYELSDEERKKRGIKNLPSSLSEALQLTEKSSFVKEVLQEHLFFKFIENKKKHIEEYEKSFSSKKEMEKYRIKISPYELQKLLPIL
ncbi:MAG: type I glutamate--ammonia ligase [Candidatus Pacearchaeota archaeon]